MTRKLKERTLEEIGQRFAQRVMLAAEGYLDSYNFNGVVGDIIEQEVSRRFKGDLENAVRKMARDAVNRLSAEEMDRYVKKALQDKF
jgi:hypothetical protein